MIKKKNLVKKKVKTKVKKQPKVKKLKKKVPYLTFQEIIFKLQKFWSDQGCVILQPYDIEVGAGTFQPATTLRSLGAKTLESSVCSTIKKANRWTLWRKSKSSSALLSISSNHKAFARRYSKVIFKKLNGSWNYL